MPFCFEVDHTKLALFTNGYYYSNFLLQSQWAFTCSKVTIETLEQGVKYVFIVNFEHISHPVLVFLALTLNM